MKPRPLEQPASGHHRIACGEPCDLLLGTQRLQALVWNISVVGVYVVMAPPLPAPGETLRLSFTLPGDRAPIACEARVKWQNGPAIFKGCGRVKLALPPGCGVEFIVLAPADLQRIEARVRATLTSAR
ncbi:MAG TPA: PilZ domain-containing protein [Vicinamibacteria bacterium]|nr:PilZ domain-containing protein [Vicinamibacteria bacterium]